MEFFDLVKNRRSIRRYKAQPVNRGDILKILDAANWAPSAMNWQPWEFVVLSGKWLKQMGDSYKSVVRNLSRSLYEKDDSNIISSDEFVRFAAAYGNAPVLIVMLTKINDDPDESKANLESACAAMQNLILAATDLGLGTCWMTSPLSNESNLRHILDIPGDREIVAVTPLGYPDAAPKPLLRIDPELRNKVKWLE
ncbi:nitroreductase [Clostridium sp. ASBs410]|nr:nitroreductase [Clostridium sp. ASBs410]